MNIRVSSPQEQPMQASKWLDVQVLLDADEMSLLLEELGSPSIYLTGCVCGVGESLIPKERFLASYAHYVKALQEGVVPEEQEFRQLFSAVLTSSADVLFSLPVSGNREIVRIAKPAIQMQFHRLGYSKADGKFRPMAFGSPVIFWGIQFSYPQLYQDMNTHKVFTMQESLDLPNTDLFKSLQRWIRQHTIPTPFVVDEKKVNVPMRLGKNCLPWINNHPHLKEQQVSVFT